MMSQLHERKGLVLMLVGALIAIVVAAVGLLLSGVMHRSPSSVANPQTNAVVRPPAGTVGVTTGRPAQLASPDGDVLVSMEAGSVDEPIALFYQPVPPDQIPELPPGYLPSEKSFNLFVSDVDGAPATSFSFNKPITITI